MFTSDTLDDSEQAPIVKKHLVPIVKKHLVVLSSFKSKSENVN